MTPGWSPVVVACWLSVSSGTPESYLGVHTVLPQFVEEQTDFGAGEGLDGLEVTAAVENSPAEQAGVQAGDVIVRLNGETVRSPAQLDGDVRSLRVGTAVELEVLRGDRLLELSTHTVARLVPLSEPDARGWLDRRHFGIVVEDVAGVPAHVGSTRLTRAPGARIRQFLPGSIAPRAGFLKGDILRQLNGETVHSGEDFLVLLGDLDPGQKVDFVVERDKRELLIRTRTRDPGSYVTTFFLPLIVDYECDEAKDTVEFGLLPFNFFKYERQEDRTTWRIIWFIEFGTGSNEDLEDLE